MKKELLVEYGRKGEVLTFLAMLLDREKVGDAGTDREGKIGRRINTESLIRKEAIGTIEAILRRLRRM